MADPVVGLMGFFASLFLIALGVPVAVSLSVVAIAGYTLLNGVSGVVFVMASAPFESLFPYSLSVIPLFLMMGVFAARCGLSTDLFLAANTLVARFRGGLAMATITACAGFGAICGSSLATVATIGRVALPEMRRAGYDDSLAAASVAAGGTLGVMIPPSILLIIYGLLTEQSIGQLFSAAILPGLLGLFLYIASVFVVVRLNPNLAGPVPQQRSVDRKAVRRAWPVAVIFTVVIGGIQIGLFSPTEAAAIGASGSVLLAWIRRSLDRAALWQSMSETVNLTGMVTLIIVSAGLFNFFIETTGLPQFLIARVEANQLSPHTTLLAIILFYLVLGCFMDAMSMIMLTIPFVFPLIISLGFDPIWFGVLVVTIAELGLITPPIGMNLFVIQGVAPGLSSAKVMRGILPFIAADIIRLALLIAIPALTLWLPEQSLN